MVFKLSNELLINRGVGGYRWDKIQDSDDSTSSDSIQRPSRRRSISIDSHLQLANVTQYSLALWHIEVYKTQTQAKWSEHGGSTEPMRNGTGSEAQIRTEWPKF